MPLTTAAAGALAQEAQDRMTILYSTTDVVCNLTK